MSYPIPPGYRPLPGGGMAMIDPTDCPAGHAWQRGQRGYAPCVEHRGHSTWTCACGRMLYGADGGFVEALHCR